MLSRLTPDESFIILSSDEQGDISIPHVPFDEIDQGMQILSGMEKKGYILRKPTETGEGFQLTMLGEYLRCAILRKERACKADHRDRMLRTGITLADEIERMCFYQRVTYSMAATKNRELLKARLFATTFAAAAYIMGRCAETPQDANDFARECIGVAMQPLAKPGSRASERDGATPFADPLMSKLLYLIKAAVINEPGVFEHKSEAFREIVETYHECLIESDGEQNLPGELRRDLELTVNSFVGYLFGVMDDLLDEVLQSNSEGD